MLLLRCILNGELGVWSLKIPKIIPVIPLFSFLKLKVKYSFKNVEKLYFNTLHYCKLNIYLDYFDFYNYHKYK